MERVLCRVHWKEAIRLERASLRRGQYANRIFVYKRWHPDGATKQCRKL